MTHGIDMGKSSWENPDGWTPREREPVPAPEPACEAKGPDGWTCDLKPNHRGNEHEADTGEGKVRWPRELAGGGILKEPATTFNREIHEQPWPDPLADVPLNEAGKIMLQIRTTATEAGKIMLQIRTTATEALVAQAPAAWAVALAEIERLTRGI
jgi:hypothetical protein